MQNGILYTQDENERFTFAICDLNGTQVRINFIFDSH